MHSVREIRFIPSTRNRCPSLTCRSETIPLGLSRQLTPCLSQSFPAAEEASQVTTKCALDNLIELYRAKCFKQNAGRGES
jgi:hypothetical protein